MRIVTVGAGGLGRAVDVLGLGHGQGDLLVALPAELGAGGEQEGVVVGRMGIVARGARAMRRRAVLVRLPDDLLVVAPEAERPEIAPLDVEQQRPGRATVGHMAVGAAVLGGRVQHAPLAHPRRQRFVAAEAGLRPVRRLELVEVLLGNEATLAMPRLRHLRPV